jgi:hypothetical protein
MSTFTDAVNIRQCTFTDAVNIRQCTFTDAVNIRQDDEIELIEINQRVNSESMNTYKVVDCCICLDTLQNNLDFIKMNCCRQKVHKICLLEWINYPIACRHYNYSNKFSCIICKTKIKNLKDIISIGDFINYIEDKKDDNNNKNRSKMVLYYKNIISELYKDSIITIVLNSYNEDYTREIRYCYYNLYSIIFLIIVIIVIIIIVPFVNK